MLSRRRQHALHGTFASVFSKKFDTVITIPLCCRDTHTLL
jgi:hypothetical protein